jgi:replicative superfamily II helicase
MMGRAGRPQFDTVGIAVVMVHAPKKAFYKRFLYEPFPVESSLSDALHNHLNAEVSSYTASSATTWCSSRVCACETGNCPPPVGPPRRSAACARATDV